MATTNSTSYGGGAGGKFPKKPSRRPQTAPYDRPPTAHRNTGWLCRLVEPASKLISSTAHKLFSSVVRNRLLPPRDNRVVPSENQLEDVTTDDSPTTQERNKNEGNAHNNGSVTDGVAELEYILKKKMFTRSEIDRITVLLQSRTVDKSGIADQRSFDSRPCDPPAGHSCLDKLDSGVVCENIASPSEVPQTHMTPAVRLKVNHDDGIASPAELAKAYMGSRSRIESPSVLARCSQAVREETHTHAAFQSHKAVVPAVQTPFSTPGASQNGFIPRSQGRSALYSMVRTPYSRVLPTDNKALKHQCSVLENDSGVVGPIRRMRQKHNLLYSKSLARSSYPTPSKQGETCLHNISKSQEDMGKGKPVSSSHMPSKSIIIGNKILQEIGIMTPPKKMSAYEKHEGKRSLDAYSVKSNDNLLSGNPSLANANKPDISLFSHMKPSSNLGLKNTPMEFSISSERGVGHRSPPNPIMNKKTEFSASSIKQITTLVLDKVVNPASIASFGLRSDMVSSASRLSSSAMESQQTNSAFACSTGATDAGIKSSESNTKYNGSVDVITNSGVSATIADGDANAAISGNSNSRTSSDAFPSFQYGLPFKGSAIASDPTVMVSFGAASSAASNFTIASTQFRASTTSTTNQLQPPRDVSSRSIFGDQILPSKTASTSTNSATANGSSVGIAASPSSVAPPLSSGSYVFAVKSSSISAPADGSSAGVPFGAFSAAVGSSSSVFAFGASSSSASPSVPSSTNMLGASSSASATPASIFSFVSSAASAPAANTPPAFGSRSYVYAFGSPAPSGANPFQFGGQQNQPATSKKPFQTSDNSNEGIFSLGASGNDKSKRRTIKSKNRARPRTM